MILFESQYFTARMKGAASLPERVFPSLRVIKLEDGGSVNVMLTEARLVVQHVGGGDNSKVREISYAVGMSGRLPVAEGTVLEVNVGKEPKQLMEERRKFSNYLQELEKADGLSRAGSLVTEVRIRNKK